MICNCYSGKVGIPRYEFTIVTMISSYIQLSSVASDYLESGGGGAKVHLCVTSVRAPGGPAGWSGGGGGGAVSSQRFFSNFAVSESKYSIVEKLAHLPCNSSQG